MDSSDKKASSACAAVTAALLLMSLFACGGSKGPGAAAAGMSDVARESPLRYAFDALDARAVSSEAFRGSAVVLAFITTWDLASQAQTEVLVRMKLNETSASKVAVAIVSLDDRANRELVEQYSKTLNVPYPMALAARTGGGDLQLLGDFGELAVPTVIVLDTQSRIVFRRTGITKPDEIRAALQVAQKP
jgi:hypothetical protein